MHPTMVITHAAYLAARWAFMLDWYWASHLLSSVPVTGRDH